MNRAYATAGGTDDRAYFYDSTGDDRFYARAARGDAYMRGSGFFNYAKYFEVNHAYATAGGTDDRAYFYDSTGDDRFVGQLTYSYMVGGGVQSIVTGFESLRVMSVDPTDADTDRAYYYDPEGHSVSEDQFRAAVAADMVFRIADDWLDSTGT
jgi:hypothetical protein